ncbi:hypothetical protein BDR04DRAFT_1145859 [Suillus decipiens]|nr:hypothetical protein BDR04DRAFT_1145859 [Suillus decipiens]
MNNCAPVGLDKTGLDIWGTGYWPWFDCHTTLLQKASCTTSLTSVKTTDTNMKTPTVLADQCWAKKFLPMILLWMGSLKGDLVLTITDTKLLKHIQIVFNVVYPELSLKVVQNGIIFSLTVQCLSEWHSNFGSTAIALIIDFLMSDKGSDPQVLACILFKDYAFLYADMDLHDTLGVYHSTFMLQLFGKVHLAAISGHANVPVLKTHVLVSGGMIGAISLCAAALECTVEMITDGDIEAEDVLASASSSKINIKLPKILNKLTGKKTSAPFLFSRDRCTKKTKNYAKSIKNKGPAFIALLTEIVCSALKENVGWDSPATDNKSDDECALS